MLKAKISMDLFTLEFKLVAEYPDMVDENNRLHKQSEEMKIRESKYQKDIADLKVDISKRDAD